MSTTRGTTADVEAASYQSNDKCNPPRSISWSGRAIALAIVAAIGWIAFIVFLVLYIVEVDGGGSNSPTCTGFATGSAATGVYVNLNQWPTNQVSAFRRCTDGALALVGSYETGGAGMPYKSAGLGPDNPLASQGAVSVAGDYLFAVNAGSSSFAMMQIDTVTMSLTLISTTPTTGTAPCTLDANVDLGTVCVAQCGGAGALTCFAIDDSGAPLTVTADVPSLGIPVGAAPAANPVDPLLASPPGLNGAMTPKQVMFTPRGDALYLILMNRGLLVFPTIPAAGGAVGLGSSRLYPVDDPSTGLGLLHRPFAFQFQTPPNGDTLILVVDPFGTDAGDAFPPDLNRGLAGGSSMSVFRIDGDGVDANFTVVSPRISTGQKLGCWITYRDSTAVVTNSVSGTISVFRHLPFLEVGLYDVGDAQIDGTFADFGVRGFLGVPEPTPTPINSALEDLSLSNDADFAYVLNSVTGTIDVFAMDTADRTFQGGSSARLTAATPIPGLVAPTSDLAVANASGDPRWAGLISVWTAWSPQIGMQGLAVYPRLGTPIP